jgi:hypothetical protein
MDKAWSLLSEMEQVGLKPDNFTYSTLIKGINPGGNNQPYYQNSAVHPASKGNFSCKNQTRGGSARSQPVLNNVDA